MRTGAGVPMSATDENGKLMNVQLQAPSPAEEVSADFEYDNDSATTATLEERNTKPQLRFYSVGPSTYKVFCPLCRQNARSETVQMTGALGQLSCLLSVLSCCFPIFALAGVYTCLQSRLKSKRLFCSSCGGHLGFHWRPT